jgi:cytochrome bd-type quinol oxidase subunit 2
MRSDPSDNGGLFVGRRPGTAPVHFRTLPKRLGERRERVDGSLANLMLAGMVFLSLLCWGPIPLGCLWIGSEIDYLSGSVSFGILAAFAALFALLFGTLALLRRIDEAWILVRRAAGHDQRAGALGRVFAATAAICALVFAFWFLIIHGPGSSSFSGQPGSG